MSKKLIMISCIFALLYAGSLVKISSIIAAGSVEANIDHLLTTAFREYNQAMLDKDPAPWLRHHDDKVFRNGLLSSQKGKDELAKYYKWEFDTFKAKCIIKNKFIRDRSAVVVFLWDAVHRKSGRRMPLDMVGVYEFGGSGRIKTVTYYFDSAKAAKFLEEVNTKIE